MKPVDIVVVSLTVAVCSILTGVMINAFLSGREISPEASEIVGGLVGSIIAIISLYVGARINGKDD